MMLAQKEALERAEATRKFKADEEQTARAALASRVVDRMNSNLKVVALLSRDLSLKVHWDDCDMDCRKFWIYINAQQALKQGDAGKMSRALRHAIMATKSLEHHSDYQWRWERISSPKSEYSVLGTSRRIWKSYSSAVWVYTLTFLG